MRQQQKNPVVIGTVGAGYAAYLHGNGYEKVCGVDFKLKGVCDVFLDKAEAVRDRYGYEYACRDYQQLLDDTEINVIDIVTPPFLHVEMVRREFAEKYPDMVCAYIRNFRTRCYHFRTF